MEHCIVVRRALILVVAVIAATAVLLSMQTDAGAGGVVAGKACVMACSPRLRQCSMYSGQEVPRRYITVRYIPRGYRRVYSSSTCENIVCTARNSICTP